MRCTVISGCFGSIDFTVVSSIYTSSILLPVYSYNILIIWSRRTTTARLLQDTALYQLIVRTYACISDVHIFILQDTFWRTRYTTSRVVFPETRRDILPAAPVHRRLLFADRRRRVNASAFVYIILYRATAGARKRFIGLSEGTGGLLLRRSSISCRREIRVCCRGVHCRVIHCVYPAYSSRAVRGDFGGATFYFWILAALPSPRDTPRVLVSPPRLHI